MPSVRQFVLTVLVLGAVAAAGAAAVVWGGLYDVAATTQHPALVFRTVATALDTSIERHAAGITTPDLSNADLVRQGLPLYRSNCAACHGEPGIAAQPIARGMTPVPPPIVSPARDRPPNELFWIVKHGIKMTGMPAWDLKLTDDQIWSLVAFVSRLPDISPAAYKAALKAPDPAQAFLEYVNDPSRQVAIIEAASASLDASAPSAAPKTASGPDTPGENQASAAAKAVWVAALPPLHTEPPEIAPCEDSMVGCEPNTLPADFGDADRGKLALHVYGCMSCHQIAGVVGRKVRVGPPLGDMSRRGLIAGILPNTPSNLVAWIRAPQSAKPSTAMPDTGVEDKTARDMVAYLYARAR